MSRQEHRRRPRPAARPGAGRLRQRPRRPDHLLRAHPEPDRAPAGEVQQGDGHRHRRRVRRLGRAGPAAGRGGRPDPRPTCTLPEPGATGFLAGRHLGQLDADVLGKVDTRFRNGDGRWVGISGRQRVLVYNSEQVTEAELPDSVLDLTGDRFWPARSPSPPPTAPSRTSSPPCGSSRGKTPPDDLAEGDGGQQTPDLRQQQRHRRGGEPRRGRDGPGQPLLQLPLPAGEPRHPEPQPHLRRRRRRRPGDPVDGQRAGRQATRPRRPPASCTSCSPRSPSATSATRPSSTRWSPACPPPPGCPRWPACTLPTTTSTPSAAAWSARWS